MGRKNPEAYKFLERPEKLKAIIANKQAEVEQLRGIAESTVSYSEGERVQSSGGKSKMADAVGRLVDMERAIDELKAKLCDVVAEIGAIIERLNVDRYDVLHKKYILGMSFDEIALARDRSKSSITTTHGRALEDVQRILTERTNENE